MAHTMPTVHDAEEAMRPYLARVYSGEEKVAEQVGWFDALDELCNHYSNALNEALALLGVRR